MCLISLWRVALSSWEGGCVMGTAQQGQWHPSSCTPSAVTALCPHQCPISQLRPVHAPLLPGEQQASQRTALARKVEGTHVVLQ